ncbi:hypothetical protein [Actinoplanes regularis]|uniref:hypothetical protein n=1 Tax=Actinoplanes regularis TaxID=52697 RepID=UPI0024A57F2B|nr:hypothetical protein [Actinoplanes regularis]GLW29609.1 hypothetical protein Areg01_25490 [Actinoplanes regularis]
MATSSKISDHPYQVMIGAGTCVLGALLTVFDPSGLAVLAAGATLVWWHRLRPSAGFAAVGAVAGAVAGTLGTLAVRTEELCCMFGWNEHRGWPYAWLSRGGGADSPEAARQMAIASGWDLSFLPFMLDVLVWGCVGMLLTIGIGLTGRAWRGRGR